MACSWPWCSRRFSSWAWATRSATRETSGRVKRWLPPVLRGKASPVIYSLFDDDLPFLNAVKAPVPPRYLRLAFLPVRLAATAGHTLSVVRSTRTELIDGVEAGFADGSLTDRQRRHLIVAIEQRHPE